MFFPTDFEDFAINKAYCNSWVATAIVGSAVIGAATTAYSANKAADTQAAAADRASQTQLQGARESNALLDKQFQQTREDLSPYRKAGEGATDELGRRLKDLTTPVSIPQEMLDLQKPLNIDQTTLETLPGYQFAKTQGLKAVQNGVTARGLGVSGAALKGAATFATGLADSNFANYFNTEMSNRAGAFARYDTTLGRNIQQQGTAYDRLKGLVDTGANAAMGTGLIGNKTATTQSGNITGAASGVATNTIGAGNAAAAATNATGNAISGAVNNIGGYYAYKGLYGGGGSGAPMSFVQGSNGDYNVPTFGRA